MSSLGRSEKAGCSISDREHACLLLRLAAAEHRAPSGMTDASVFDDSIFGFHAQQVVEKSLKAWLSGIGAEYPRTHDLSLLLARLADASQDVDGLDHLVEYSAFAVQFRYEAFDDPDDPLLRRETVDALRRLIERVQGALDLN